MYDGIDPSDPISQIPLHAYWHLIRTLRLTLPPPPGDSPEDLTRRDHAAVARIAALAPANAAEADVAAQFVAASEQWKDCLRLAQQPETTPEWAGKCRAQAASMMRQANSALRLLLRMQELRRRLEADSATCNSLAWTEHCAAGLMAEALSALGPEELKRSEPPEAASDPGSGRPASKLAGTACPGPAKASAEPVPGCPGPGAAAAEQYTAIYPERAALIRRLGRVPEDAPFGPPDSDLAQALIAARTPALVALDREFPGPGESLGGSRGCPVPPPEARAA